MPAVHSRHRHSHERAQTVTHVEHQGTHDVTSVFEVVPPSLPSYSSINMEAEAALSLSLSIPPCAALSPRDTLTRKPAPTTALIHPTPQATMSQYPNPSPPSFLNPQSIVQPQVYPYTMRQNDEEHGPRPLHRSPAHKELYEAPTPLIAVLVFVVIAVVASWSVVVMLIHWRSTTTGMQPVFQRRRISKQKEPKGGNWWTRMCRLSPRAEKGEYEVLRSGDGHAPSHVDQIHALSSAHNWSAQVSSHDAGTASPVNPYLVPPDQPLQLSMRRLRPRDSAEWAEERRAFFSPQSLEVQSRGSSSSNLLSDAESEDVECEAREAQGRQASLVRHQLEANWSWMDQGLAAVDGAVDRFAGKIVRWTDDGGKDEALLLPLAKGKQH